MCQESRRAVTATLGKQKKTCDTESEESADTARKATPQPRDTDRPQGAVPLSISNHAAAVLTQRNWLAHAFLLAGILVVPRCVPFGLWPSFVTVSAQSLPRCLPGPRGGRQAASALCLKRIFPLIRSSKSSICTAPHFATNGVHMPWAAGYPNLSVSCLALTARAHWQPRG